MASTVNYLDPVVLADLDGLALRTHHIIEAFLAGSHRSARIGSSTDFSEHRPYVPGDDLRHLDWKVYGRSDRLYVKQFLDETNLACTFLLDDSRSMHFKGASTSLTKLEYGGCVAAAIAWLLRNQGDAIGLATLAGVSELRLPPASNDVQLVELIRLLEITCEERASSIESSHQDAESSHSLADSIRHWAAGVQNRQLVVIVSDLFDDPNKVELALTDLRQYGHEVVVIQVCDSDEIEFPFHRYTQFCNVENSDEITLDAQLFREGYLKQFNSFVDQIRMVCAKSSIDFLQVATNQSLGKVLGHFLANRQSVTMQGGRP